MGQVTGGLYQLLKFAGPHLIEHQGEQDRHGKADQKLQRREHYGVADIHTAERAGKKFFEPF